MPETPRVDVFSSPSMPQHEYTVRDNATPEGILDGGFDNTVVITSEGADLHTAQALGQDAPRLKPRISTEKSLAEQIADANFRWSAPDEPGDTSKMQENS